MSASIIYEKFFRRCAELLSDDGVMLVHSIGRSNGPGVTSPWITKYIFPGGYIPACPRSSPQSRRAGLLVATSKSAAALCGNAEGLARTIHGAAGRGRRLYDERFARMWEFYLAASEMSFRKQNLMNFQVQLTRRQGVVRSPVTISLVKKQGCAGLSSARSRGCGWPANEPKNG